MNRYKRKYTAELIILDETEACDTARKRRGNSGTAESEHKEQAAESVYPTWIACAQTHARHVRVTWLHGKRRWRAPIGKTGRLSNLPDLGGTSLSSKSIRGFALPALRSTCKYQFLFKLRRYYLLRQLQADLVFVRSVCGLPLCPRLASRHRIR